MRKDVAGPTHENPRKIAPWHVSGSGDRSMAQRIAHLSDLHLGVSKAAEKVARALAAKLHAERPELVVISGDITQRARPEELALFEDIFGDLRPVVVPGNHDRLGVGLDGVFMQERVALVHRAGVSVLRIDSTGPHNTSMHTPQGMLTVADLEAINRALSDMPANVLCVATLHHHSTWLPEDDMWERIGGWLGITRVEHLHCGDALLALLARRCDVVLSGHRHVPHHQLCGPVDVFTAGSSTELARYRELTHESGKLLGAQWITAPRPARQPSRHAAWARASSPRLGEALNS